MNITTFVAQMNTNAEIIRQLVTGISDGQANWKPDTETWSIVEVINHLYEEERWDFRVRLDHILHKPGTDFPEIDPVGWVVEHAYNERALEPSLRDFLQERKKSLQWLDTLTDPDWEASRDMPWGTIRAGDMFAAWVAHDLLHIRQLVELHYAWTTRQVQPYQVRYAGEW